MVYVYKDQGNYKEALSAYEDFSQNIDSINYFKFEQKLQSLEEKHGLELRVEIDKRQKLKIIWSCIVGLIILIMVMIMLILLVRTNKNKKNLALQKIKIVDLENEKLKQESELALKRARLSEIENEKLRQEKELAIQKAKTVDIENEKLKIETEVALQKVRIADLENSKLMIEKDLIIQKSKTTNLENEILKAEKENLSLENKNLLLERDNKALEAENLAHRIEVLEDESQKLKKLLVAQDDIPMQVQEAIRIRIEMLNSLLAQYITSNDKYSKPYDMWVKELINNTEEFMNSTRLAFQASHPRFIQYFMERGLTESEINYVCLYAIGLHGKEVGDYMKKRSHVNISSAIRKKLGIDKHETNIGIYVRTIVR